MTGSNALDEALQSPEGQRYYRALSERFAETVDEPELPADAVAGPAGELKRRELLALLGASLALGGLTGCGQKPREKILPYVRTPSELEPGVPTVYATTMTLGGFGTGLLGLVQDGRPIKLDGNPDHPAALGGSRIYEQAAVLGLYQPTRLTSPLQSHMPADWSQAAAALRACGPRSVFVLPPQTSPLVADLVQRIRARLPQAKFCYYSALSRSSVYEASRRVFGRELETHYDLAQAPVVLALDADFFSQAAGSLRLARQFAERRRLAAPSDAMSRLYVAEAMLSPTGSLADHRLALASHRVPLLARAVLQHLHELGSRVPGIDTDFGAGTEASPFDTFARAVARDLAQAPGRALVLVGERQPPETHVLGHAINAALRNFGQTVHFSDSPLLEPDGGESLESVADAIEAGAVDALIILEENLVYSAPPALRLGALLPRVPQRFHLTDVENETSRLCQWRLPLSHFLESWGDARAQDGTLSFVQPLIEPLHASRSTAEVLAIFAGRPDSGHELLRELYRGELGVADFEEEWERRLRVGFAAGTAAPRVEPVFRPEALLEAARAVAAAAQVVGKIELNLGLGNVHDGRFANNAWLLELPHPTTKQCWGNAAVLGPAMASRLHIESGDVLAIAAGDRRIEAPALILPGHADDALSLDVGYGSLGEGLGRGVGVNAYALRARVADHFESQVSVTVTGRRAELALTQEHFRLHGRDYVRAEKLAEYRKLKVLAPEQKAPQRSLLPTLAARGTQWAMSIDTMICSGCSACVVACQAENNVPVVGKQGVMKSREMHWLRIDRYFEGDVNAPSVVNQPMLCQHCEKAPCEYVCPVNATVHSPDGLNEMVYNRCIGTRFCSNNCPYKVRRFNWFDYSAEASTPRLQKNPEVTVRERGVMEKCTFCVQRIRRAERQAHVEQRPEAAHEVVTACQAACPTGAIQFGSLDVPDSAMTRWRSDGRSYAALHELGTHPRVRYLAKIGNPNPDLEK
jgi:Fe-S-cluster-containing dehydrogenase component